MSESAFDQLGGEPVLRAVIDRFIDRVFDDVLIGFHFRDADRERIKAKEYEFAARHLGGGVRYTGKPLQAAHGPHGIMGGQFSRRLEILGQTLDELGVPAAIRDHWLGHNETLRGLITGDDGDVCDGRSSRKLPNA